MHKRVSEHCMLADTLTSSRAREMMHNKREASKFMLAMAEQLMRTVTTHTDALEYVSACLRHVLKLLIRSSLIYN